MTNPLAHFAAACHDALKADPGPRGRRQICALLADLLKDQGFIAAHLPENGPEREILYEDAELGFCICAHVNRNAKHSEPHDHGPSWAIYGQAAGETVMTDWEKLEPATEASPGKVRALRSYTLKPGMLRLYNEGDLHSPSRTGATRLIRIEGVNMDKVKRLKYVAVETAH
jgi:hypothetical protein